MTEQFLLYEYDADGFHHGAMQISEDSLGIVFETIIRVAKEEKRKVIITDIW